MAPSRPLAERITLPGNRSRSLSPGRELHGDAVRKDIDRYQPGGKGSRSRSPIPNRRREGRRPGAGRERVGRGNGAEGGGQRAGRDGRPKKTQEELDAEMEDYFTGAGGAQPEDRPAAANGSAAAPPVQQDGPEDIDMIE